MLKNLLILMTIAFSTTTLSAAAPVADAAEKADWQRVVQAMLHDGGEVNAAQADGATALHWATYHDKLEIARLLITAGANAKTENRYGVTPLSLACTNGNAEMVKLLLSAGADPNTTLRGDETVLMTAARTGRVEPVQALLQAGAKVDAVDRKGQTALMWAAADGNIEVVELLIKAGADIRLRLRSGFTPMLFAARQGKIEVVQAFLKAGIEANEAIQTTGRGGAPRVTDSALILAVENGHFELAMELIKAGADPNDERSGFTPLHALTWVRKPNRGDEADGQPSPVGSGNLTSLEFARRLVASGADVTRRLARGSGGGGKLNVAGATPFLLASRTADLAYMKLLVELSADPMIPNKEGCTPLMAAAGIGVLAPGEEAGTEAEALAAVEYLLAKGADINTVDQNGETVMHAAAYKSLPKMVQLLAERGAKIEIWNKKNRYGWTPLLIAQGYRPGNFRPLADTIAAIERVMLAAGVTPPPAPAGFTTAPTRYDERSAGQGVEQPPQ
jgi:uncharacterized protein